MKSMSFLKASAGLCATLAVGGCAPPPREMSFRATQPECIDNLPAGRVDVTPDVRTGIKPFTIDFTDPHRPHVAVRNETLTGVQKNQIGAMMAWAYRACQPSSNPS